MIAPEFAFRKFEVHSDAVSNSIRPPSDPLNAILSDFNSKNSILRITKTKINEFVTNGSFENPAQLTAERIFARFHACFGHFRAQNSRIQKQEVTYKYANDTVLIPRAEFPVFIRLIIDLDI